MECQERMRLIEVFAAATSALFVATTALQTAIGSTKSSSIAALARCSETVPDH